MTDFSKSATPAATVITPCDALTVMFDGACPLCRREVAIYQGLVPLRPLRWLDVSSANTFVADPAERMRLMSRFHVRQADGELLSGANAFVALWLHLPGWRWLGRAASLPGASSLLEFFYVLFLRLRPRIQRMAKTLESGKP